LPLRLVRGEKYRRQRAGTDGSPRLSPGHPAHLVRRLDPVPRDGHRRAHPDVAATLVAEPDRPDGLDGVLLAVLRTDVEQISFVRPGRSAGLGPGHRSAALPTPSALSAGVQGD